MARRAKKTRCKIKSLGVNRLTTHRTPNHIYAQIIDPEGRALVCASTTQKEIKKNCTYGGNVSAAKTVGEYIAKRAIEKGLKNVAFDRSGLRYHGRIKALADAAREAGLIF